MLKQSHPIQNLFGATRYECLNCGNALYSVSPPTDPCPWCGLGPDSEPEPAPDYEEVEVTAYECNRCHNTMWYERAPTGPCPFCAFGDGDERSDNWKFYTEVKVMRTKPNPQERGCITVRRYECLRCGNALYFTSPPTGPCPFCGLGDDLPAGWTYYAIAICGKPALTPTRGDSSFYAAKKKQEQARNKQGNKYWRKRFLDQLHAIEQFAAFYDPDLRKYPANYWSFSPAYSAVYDKLKSMSDELARLKGIEEEYKRLASQRDATE